MQNVTSKMSTTGNQMRCHVGTTRNHSMTIATAMSEKAKLTSENKAFCTGNTKRCTLTFLRSDEASMIEVRAELVDSDISVKVMLPTIR